MIIKFKLTVALNLVCYTAVFGVVTQCSSFVEFNVTKNNNNNKLVGSYLRCASNPFCYRKLHGSIKFVVQHVELWGFISSMRSFVACHIPDRQSHVQIGFDQPRSQSSSAISDVTSPVNLVGKRLGFDQIWSRLQLRQWRALDLRTRTFTSVRFNLKFLRVF